MNRNASALQMRILDGLPFKIEHHCLCMSMLPHFKLLMLLHFKLLLFNNIKGQIEVNVYHSNNRASTNVAFI